MSIVSFLREAGKRGLKRNTETRQEGVKEHHRGVKRSVEP
jgi:hypothetical protein